MSHFDFLLSPLLALPIFFYYSPQFFTMESNQQPVEAEESNQQPVEAEELCSICLDSLPKLASKFTRMTCCGKGLHNKCYDNIFKSSMSHKLKNQCIMCRTVSHKSDEEQTERVRRWVEKEKAWAQSILAQRYEHGLGVEQSYQRAAELYDLAASQGYATA